MPKMLDPWHFETIARSMVARQRAADAKRAQLLVDGRTGDAGALIVLYEMYGLRLPLAEARCEASLPWTRGHCATRRVSDGIRHVS